MIELINYLCADLQDKESKKGNDGTMFNVEDCIALLTNNGSKTICEAMNRLFLENDITRLQWTALYYIRHSNRITQKDLADLLMISCPSSTNLVHRLMRAGLVSREDDPDDFRSKLLRITAKGEQAYLDSYPIVESFNASVTEGISDEDLKTFKDVFNKMLDNVRSKEGVQENDDSDCY